MQGFQKLSNLCNLLYSIHYTVNQPSLKRLKIKQPESMNMQGLKINILY